MYPDLAEKSAAAATPATVLGVAPEKGYAFSPCDLRFAPQFNTDAKLKT